MTTYAVGGVLVASVLSQESASDLMDAALSGDVGMTQVLQQGAQLTGLGVSPTDAALIMAALVFGIKLLDVNKGTFQTLNLWLRRVLKLEDHDKPGA